MPDANAAVAQEYNTVTPYLIVPDVARQIDFLTRAFGAVERGRVPRGDGTIMHAEVVIGDSIVMMGEPTGDTAAMPAAIFLRVPDADAAYRAALDAGATSISEPKDQPHGHRYGGVKDPCGNLWWPATPL
jgi:PhnB protein